MNSGGANGPASEAATSDLPSESVAVRVRNLSKSYAGVPAVRGVDLDIAHGEIFALLGPNGAGKTTTVEILEGYRDRDGGEVSVLGVDPGRHRGHLKSRIGIVLQSTGVERYLTALETITMYAGFFPNPREPEEVIDLVGLTAKRNDRVIKLSGGQQRRLDVAIALVGDPELLFLDEPTTGFDPSARHEAWDVVESLASLGKTVVLTTHYMEEAQHLADRVAVVVDGRIIAGGPPDSLAQRDRAQTRIRFRVPNGVDPPAGIGGPPTTDGVVNVSVDDVVPALEELLGWARKHGLNLDSLEVTKPSLEDVYLSLTGSSGRPERTAPARRETP
ncbi:MAG: ABC transporter ATP-binding protein [Acidimicrobiales bacterium]